MADLKLVPAAPPGAPPGWALVPLEPTPQMLAAGQMAWVRDPLRKSSTLYRAMVGAAPHPSGVRVDGAPEALPPSGDAAHVGPPDWLRLARECGASVYRNRAMPEHPGVAFGDESWARFTAALTAVTVGAAAPLTKQLPMVPTNHMMNAAVNAWHSWKSRDSGGNVQLLGKLVWEHMADAAPEPGAWDDTSGVPGTLESRDGQ